MNMTPEHLLRRLIATTPSCAQDSLLSSAAPLSSSPGAQDWSGAAEPPPAAAAAAAGESTELDTVPVECADALGYAEFVGRFMAPNTPVLIKGACRGWRSLRDWVCADGASVNLGHLQQLAGHCSVAVTDTARHHQGSGPCRDMTFEQYCTWWHQHQDTRQQQQQRHGQDTCRQQQQQQQQAVCMDCTADRQPLLYLKDWHFVGEFAEYQAYTTPAYFQDDWLNEFYDHKQQQQLGTVSPLPADAAAGAAAAAPGAAAEAFGGPAAAAAGNVVTRDYRFVYLGPAGSWTPVHSDVLRSYSWSANVVGKKRWLLLPPQHTHLFVDGFGQLPPDFAGPPDSPQAQGRWQEGRRHLLELVQEAGDVLFVPSGWHHSVTNECDTLSINHNWINGHNLHHSWALLAHEHSLATHQLEDCRSTASAEEFEVLVQRMLAANSGFDYKDFAAFVVAIARRRLQAAAGLLRLQGQQQQQQQEEEEKDEQQGQQYLWGRQLQPLQLAFDLVRAAHVLQLLQAAVRRAAARNAAWWGKQRGSRPKGVAGVACSAAADEAGSSEHDAADKVSGSAVQLPCWLQEVLVVIQEAQQTAQLLQEQHG